MLNVYGYQPCLLKKLPEKLGLHCYAVSIHPDELVRELPLKKILDPPMLTYLPLSAEWRCRL